MLRIGIIELGVTCGLITLAFLIPLIVARGYNRLNKRMKELEDRLAKKH
jgi:hypothetical protein